MHVVPVGDLIEHDTEGPCPCGPTDQPVPRDDGSIGWIAVHHSLDGRERHERPAVDLPGAPETTTQR
jgi:hypothetical protein